MPGRCIIQGQFSRPVPICGGPAAVCLAVHGQPARRGGPCLPGSHGAPHAGLPCRGAGGQDSAPVELNGADASGLSAVLNDGQGGAARVHLMQDCRLSDTKILLL
eukprot:1153080-Pelagomonas_calceolata.AAC.2